MLAKGGYECRDAVEALAAATEEGAGDGGPAGNVPAQAKPGEVAGAMRGVSALALAGAIVSAQNWPSFAAAAYASPTARDCGDLERRHRDNILWRTRARPRPGSPMSGAIACSSPTASSSERPPGIRPGLGDVTARCVRARLEDVASTGRAGRGARSHKGIPKTKRIEVDQEHPHARSDGRHVFASFGVRRAFTSTSTQAAVEGDLGPRPDADGSTTPTRWACDSPII